MDFNCSKINAESVFSLPGILRLALQYMIMLSGFVSGSAFRPSYDQPRSPPRASLWEADGRDVQNTQDQRRRVSGSSWLHVFDPFRNVLVTMIIVSASDITPTH